MPASSSCLGVRLAGDLIGDVDERGEPIVGETLLMLLNAHHEPIPFTLPETSEGRAPLGTRCSTRPTRASTAHCPGRGQLSAAGTAHWRS